MSSRNSCDLALRQWGLWRQPIALSCGKGRRLTTHGAMGRGSARWPHQLGLDVPPRIVKAVRARSR